MIDIQHLICWHILPDWKKFQWFWIIINLILMILCGGWHAVPQVRKKLMIFCWYLKFYLMVKTIVTLVQKNWLIFRSLFGIWNIITVVQEEFNDFDWLISDWYSKLSWRLTYACKDSTYYSLTGSNNLMMFDWYLKFYLLVDVLSKWGLKISTTQCALHDFL